MATSPKATIEKTEADDRGEVRRWSKEQPPSMEDLRIVLVGRTGAGKSASRNTILGRPEFKVGITTQSVTKQCQIMSEINTRISVVDTPGLFNTELSESSLMKQLLDCITLSSPGPHAFLLVTALHQFTNEEKLGVEQIQSIFGEAASTHTIVLFTHGDKLNNVSIEEFIKKAGEDLQELLKMCNNHYHVFNNVSEDRQQVIELLNKIKQMTDTGLGFYTNEMYQHVESTIQRTEEELKQHYDKKLRDLEKQLQDMKDEIKRKEAKTERATLRKKRSQVRDEATNDGRLAGIFRFQKSKFKSKCTVQ